MEKSYAVYLDSARVGEVTVEQQGLYYAIRCHCRLKPGMLCRLYADDLSLGVLAPERGMYSLITQRSIKTLCPEKARFEVRPDGQKLKREDVFVPLYPDGPIDCLADLEKARFGIRDGVPGLIIPKEK